MFKKADKLEKVNSLILSFLDWNVILETQYITDITMHAFRTKTCPFYVYKKVNISWGGNMKLSL